MVKKTSLAEISSFHETAMSFVDQALLCRDPEKAREFFRSAFERERRAAELWEHACGHEPTRAVLYRSAATLARDCQDYSEARRLVQKGLEGQPPDDIAEELREVLRLVNADEARGPAQTK